MPEMERIGMRPFFYVKKGDEMPELCRFLGIVIQMYFNDHVPPHFHALYNDLEGMFDLTTLEMIDGDLPARVKGLVVEWASLHKEELMNNWVSLTKTGEFKKIDPLV